SEPRPLGAARAGRRGQVSDLDGREPAPAGCLSRFARGQAGGRGPPSFAAREICRAGEPGCRKDTTPAQTIAGPAREHPATAARCRRAVKGRACRILEHGCRRSLVYLGRRPLKLVRRVKGTTFYHMGPLPELPPAVKQLSIKMRKGGAGTRLWI